MDELIKQINMLAKKSREEGLTSEEIKLQKELREKYLKIFHQNFENQILNLRILDENNNDVTPNEIIKKKDKNNDKK